MASRSTHNLKPSASSFDLRDVPSMGDPEFVEGRVRVMLDEARKLLFEAPNPRAGVLGLVERWAKEFSPANTAYTQTMSVAALDTFLKARGLGSADTNPGDPVKALVAQTLDRFVTAATAFHEEKTTESQLAFAIDAAVEDCVSLLRGLDNPAD